MHDIDTSQKWKFPVARKNSLENNFNDSRVRAGRWTEKHNAIDILAKVGSEIVSPVSGVVIVFRKKLERFLQQKEEFQYESGGLVALAGNGAIIFNPKDTSYFYLIHMKDVRLQTGDIVSKGELLGTVGITGNAIYPTVKKASSYSIQKTRQGVLG